MRYRIMKGGSHTRFEDGMAVTYSRGDVIELNAEEAGGNSLSGRVEPVAVPSPVSVPMEDAGYAPDAPDEAEPIDLAFLDGQWRAVVKAVKALDDLAVLEAALEAEDVGRARKSVLLAIGRRMDEVDNG
jgi:hypothetical protein